jgi:transposase-like protein
MSKRYAPEVREEVVKKIRNGQKVLEVAKLHGINEMTVESHITEPSTIPHTGLQC